MRESPEVEVVADPEHDRFVIRVDGVEAGHSEYVRKGDLVVFTHTEIDSAFEGQGLGSKLARSALDAVRATGDPIVPLCPFIASFIGKHPEYDDLVDHECLDFMESRGKNAKRRSSG
jgi:predicted GNAT family acetyltransferase